jgi:hypothetical protein
MAWAKKAARTDAQQALAPQKTVAKKYRNKELTKNTDSSFKSDHKINRINQAGKCI